MLVVKRAFLLPLLPPLLLISSLSPFWSEDISLLLLFFPRCCCLLRLLLLLEGQKGKSLLSLSTSSLLFSLSFPKQEAKAGGAISPSLTFLPPSAFFLPSSQRASDKEGVDRGEKEEEEEEKPGREERERETGWRGKRAHPREGKVPRSGLAARHKKRGGYSVGKGRGRRFVCCLFLCRCCFSSDL